MLDKIKDKIENTFMIKNTGNNKKKIENLAVGIVILIITLITINIIWNDKSSTKNTNEIVNDKILATKSESEDTTTSTNTNLEEKLENILGKIQGVGKVEVLLTYSESSKTMAMYNEDNTKSDTEENDTSGGNRKISQTSNKKEIIYQEIDGNKIPITQSTVTPKVEGAIVTAVGAKNSITKTNIIQAVEAVTGLAAHKIQVFEMIK